MSPSTHRVQLLRAPPPGPAVGPATLALARTLQLSRTEAGLLLGAAPCVLPRGLAPDAAAGLLRALQAAGAEARVLEAPASAGRCSDHAALEDDGSCEGCGARTCALCTLVRGARRCAACERRRSRARHFKALRVAVLLGVLCVAAGWAFSVQRGRDARTAWVRPLRVAVVLVGEDTRGSRALADSAPELEDWFARELRRYRPEGLERPVQLQVFGPVVAGTPLPWPAEDGGWLARLRYARALDAALAPVNAAVGLTPRGYDARLYAVVEPGGAGSFAEGIGAAGGELGLVRVRVDGADATLALTALAHELLHCLGATDKYDAGGHARLPEGLAEPERALPQRRAEVMVGEVPLAAGSGRLPESLEEVSVGPVTAREVHWSDVAP
ncbi:hypothetical protein FGE12_08440 [Aggregicoccus sp. 17bor-14]|uniref:hypothetical protein n=1 Tax=Myxococcaceae TaxID=31 RepID=UPI00129C5352|nr:MULTISPECIES: hypothetical protein [Myxococcaceae]MBF5042426.1 hypothetical protein [Simulacricoccus sp. 17bor-14]MRI88198.1 hypothetical protein [Aggregicoccus sp. 17bor-14]